jgi:hypothetical protein
LPAADDDVFADGRTVTIDQNVAVLSIRRTQRTGGTAGGIFSVSGNRTITADIISGAGNILNTGSGTVYINGNIYGPTSSSQNGVVVGSNCIVWHTGNIFGAAANSSSTVFMSNVAVSTWNITGNIFGGTDVGSVGINAQATCIINVTGNVTGGNVAGNNGATGITVSGTGTVTIIGTVTGGITSFGVNNAAGGTVVIIGSAIGGVGNEAVRNTSIGTVRVTKAIGNQSTGSTAGVSGLNINGITTVREMEFGPLGQAPVIGFVRFETGYAPKVKVTRQNGTAVATDYAQVEAELPAVNNVRFGTSYNSGTKTGTVRVPTAANVRAGVPVDNTVGTATLDAAVIWARATSELTTPDSIGARLKNAATVETTGSTIAALIHN